MPCSSVLTCAVRACREDLDGILEFAHQHTDGRYLIEVINPEINVAYTEASFDARALNAYLGSQGNETLSAVFHEASPNALFMLPATNALSNYPDSFGVSSVLADDLDYVAQPLSAHIERARWLGVRYLAIRTPSMKERIEKESAVQARYDFGWWSLFVLRDEPPPRARVLPYRPALVVSDFTLKQRRRNDWGFVRLAEEQFASGWFDVLLVRSPESKIDRLGGLDLFGALILDTYDYDDENRAYERLKEFAHSRRLILLSNDSALFRRISAARAEFPLVEIIERPGAEPGEPLEAFKPTQHYGQSVIRQVWGDVRRSLEEGKSPVELAETHITSDIGQNEIRLQIDAAAPAESIPILLSMSFHPNWRREDGEALYAATPFYTLTFTRHSAQLVYERRPHELAAMWISVGALLFLCLLLFIGKRPVPNFKV